MRLPLFKLFKTSPFGGIEEHMEKVKECAWAFQQALECHITEQCHTFDDFRSEVDRLESEADVIKRRIRGHLPKGTLMPVDKFQLFRYLREQDNILDAVEEALDWISYRAEPGIPEALHKDFALLIDAVLGPVEEMSRMVTEARRYFKTFSENARKTVKDTIHAIHEGEHEADKVEDALKRKVMNTEMDPVTVFHMVRLAETIGSIADHAENAGDMMRAMVAR
jgi:predicted phosphate transport protein (TIGR00153 family)